MSYTPNFQKKENSLEHYSFILYVKKENYCVLYSLVISIIKVM